MCSDSCIAFVERYLQREEVQGKRILEVGSQDVNGSIRSLFLSFAPQSYTGVDLIAGKGVDEICDAVDLVDKFGARSFDVVVSTEMLEHVRDWRATISNLKRVLRPGGFIYITTRSEGFPYHEYPEDHWRFSVEDMQKIFSDFIEVIVLSDLREPGVFVKAKRSARYRERDLSNYALYDVTKEMREELGKI